MPDKSRNSATIRICLSDEHKELIERAALSSGQSVSDFARTTLLSQARQVLAGNTTTRLSARDYDRFVAIIDDDRPPNAALTSAVMTYLKN